MPGIFPARRLADHMYVDGGVKDVVPVKFAVQELGCNEVVAIRVSAWPADLATDPRRSVGEVMARSVLELTFDEVAEDDVAPFAGWGEGVKVSVIRPNFNLHDAMVVEPGLIRIGIDYGWMRAADILDVSESRRRYAEELSDRIIRLRAENWTLAHYAAGSRYQDPHRGFSKFVLAGVAPSGGSVLQPVPTPEAVDTIRANCRRIRDTLPAPLDQRADPAVGGSHCLVHPVGDYRQPAVQSRPVGRVHQYRRHALRRSGTSAHLRPTRAAGFRGGG